VHALSVPFIIGKVSFIGERERFESPSGPGRFRQRRPRVLQAPALKARMAPKGVGAGLRGRRDIYEVTWFAHVRGRSRPGEDPKAARGEWDPVGVRPRVHGPIDVRDHSGLRRGPDGRAHHLGHRLRQAGHRLREGRPRGRDERRDREQGARRLRLRRA